MNTASGLSYVLPIRRDQAEGLDELGDYLARLTSLVGDLIVVDGSKPDVFAAHSAVLPADCRHLPPHADLDFEMGKVNGVITGVREAQCPLVVIADDDVRHDATSLARIAGLLGEVELVRPQNYFKPLPWHARWDTGRTLLNRVFSGDPRHPAADFPGTLGVRRDFLLQIGGYDGDLIFENLELIRTVEAAGGRSVSPLDLYVPRRPPSTSHFLSQRPRQAYDDWALPLRMAFFLAVVPTLVVGARARRWRAIGSAAVGIAALAELGRRRTGGTEVFPASGSLLAPAWVLERGVFAWVAAYDRWVRGGTRYGDRRLKHSATSVATLRARYSPGPADAPTWALGPKPVRSRR